MKLLLSLLFALLAVLILALCIVLLHKLQLRKVRQSLDKSTPLDAPELDFTGTLEDPTSSEAEGILLRSWQGQVKHLRLQQDFRQALRLCEEHFPRTEAFRQAMTTHRAHLKAIQKQGYDSEEQLAQLYRLACLGDYFRPARLQSIQHISALIPQTREKLEQFPDLYHQLGYQQLKLLNKTDIRRLEQTWGVPPQHRHSEELLDETDFRAS